jgi:hypothetical protein
VVTKEADNGRSTDSALATVAGVQETQRTEEDRARTRTKQARRGRKTPFKKDER